MAAAAAAATLSLSLVRSQQNHYDKTTLSLFTLSPFIIPTKHSLFSLKKPHHYPFRDFHSSSSSSSSNHTTSSFLHDSFRTGRFLTNEEIEKLKNLENFVHFQELKSGFLWVRVMRPEDMDSTVGLLAQSFAESMLLRSGYEKLLSFLVKQYLVERRGVMPHAVTLIGFYRGKEEEEPCKEVDLVGTVEVCFDSRGANASPPTPTPPRNSPYICNMTVKMPLRRKGIGWHLLKASEELISQMSSSKDVYLHCRMIDAAPFNMYRKAGYNIIKTDSILILLMLQRRKHLMCKKLTVFESPSKSDMSASDEEFCS
ncbi:uncharacterized protein LOC123214616 [Mangifera indica]|uniref:uncharacterized protein LOC123214616 n=1 Tax=Mangifera indica TaxID=29780 RepID=UPI001CF9346D|nr:uncharacterized protein LOC123214616 [Mangifera indica]